MWVPAAVVAPPAQARSDYEFWRDRSGWQGARVAGLLEEFYSQCLAPAGLDFQTVTAAVLRPWLAPRAPSHPCRRRCSSAEDWDPLLELVSSLLAAWGLPAR